MPQGYKKDGTPANPTGAGGFRDNPENRSKTGVSGKAHANWHRAAEAVSEVQADQAEALERIIKGNPKDGDIEKVKEIRSDINTFIKQVMDRAHGTPKSSVDLSSEDGSMTPRAAHSDAVLDALKAKHGKPNT